MEVTNPPALPKWEGSLIRDGQGECPCKEGFGFSPLGETGEGFVRFGGELAKCLSIREHGIAEAGEDDPN